MAKKLGEMLIEEGLINQGQLQAALDEQKKSRVFLGAALVKIGAVTEEQLVDVLARQPGVVKIDLDKVDLDGSLAAKIPEDLARKRGCIPISLTGKMLQVGFLDPLDDRTIDFIGGQTGLTIKVCAVTPTGLEKALERLYGKGGAGAPAGGKPAAGRAKEKEKDKGKHHPTIQVPTGKALEDLVHKSVQEISDAEIGDEEETGGREAIAIEVDEKAAPIIRISNLLLLKALELHASDIHVEPHEDKIRIRYRVDGSLHEMFSLPVSIRNNLISRIKIMSEMDVAERRIPQDGRIKFETGDGSVLDLRINTLPGIFGEKIVMRLLGTGQLKGRVADLGFIASELECIETALDSAFGMILVTGPTGSGKTTTLYTMLNQLNTEDVNIVTAEDPVEYNLPGIHQVNVRPAIGFTFDTALRSFLRQDPDIILVGEMRDYETAAIAVKAALTGHLVLSTLHTNDAPSTVVRLVDMGIEPYLVASAVKIVIAQRLVRKICDNCREEVPISEAEKTDLHKSVLASMERMFRGKGCDVCNKIGYKGRVPIFEVMVIKTKDMRRVITEGGTEVQVVQVARREGLVTLRESAMRLVNEGVISLEEGIKAAVAD